MSLLMEATVAVLLAGQVVANGEPTTSPLGLAAEESSSTAQDDSIVVTAPFLYPSAGLMNDHMHEGGEAMVGLRFERSRWSGANQRRTRTISDPEIVAAGYSSRTKSMTMDMLMLDLMYAPSDDVTLMLMPHYMWHQMTMVGIDPAGGHGGDHGHAGHGGHAMMLGGVHKHQVNGFGDTLASASFRLARHRRFNAHMTLGLWVPTGRSDRKNADGTFVHYGMQPGAGTWDIEPALNVSGKTGQMGWGAQGIYRWRVSEANKSGFRFGDKARLSGWLSYLFRPKLGATARIEYLHEGAVEGHYNGPHHHSAPPDRQENHGGKTLSAALGLNRQPPLRGAFRLELGIGVSVPVYQKLNGMQAPQDWRLSTAVRQTF